MAKQENHDYKALIKEKGLSVVFVAKKLGMSRQTLYTRFKDGYYEGCELVILHKLLGLK